MDARELYSGELRKTKPPVPVQDITGAILVLRG